MSKLIVCLNNFWKLKCMKLFLLFYFHNGKNVKSHFFAISFSLQNNNKSETRSSAIRKQKKCNFFNFDFFSVLIFFSIACCMQYFNLQCLISVIKVLFTLDIFAIKSFLFVNQGKLKTKCNLRYICFF